MSDIACIAWLRWGDVCGMLCWTYWYVVQGHFVWYPCQRCHTPCGLCDHLLLTTSCMAHGAGIQGRAVQRATHWLSTVNLMLNEQLLHW
jgi:hypothetical protein